MQIGNYVAQFAYLDKISEICTKKDNSLNASNHVGKFGRVMYQHVYFLTF